MNDKYFIYILKCSDGSYYVGSTGCLIKRLGRHNAGLACKWTKYRLPVNLIYSEIHPTLKEARQREKQIKNWSRKKKENLVTNQI